MSGGIPHYNKDSEPQQPASTHAAAPPASTGPVQYDPNNPNWVPPNQRPQRRRRPLFDRSGSWSLLGIGLFIAAGAMSQSSNPDTVDWSYVVGGFATFCFLVVAIALGVKIGIWESEDEDAFRS